MNPDFKAAAEAGNLNMLYTQIKKDAYVLEKIDKIPFVDTPLHIAAAAGKIRFATEIIRLMPTFAQKLNEEGLSPLHLAIQNVGMVYRFLSINKDLVRLKGREGLTPLHFAAESANVAILAVLLSACPDSIQDFSVEGETALHIAGKMGHFDALRILVEWLQKYHSSQSRSRILNWKNESGDTVLHVSARRNVDAQTVQLLRENGMNLNVKNSGGLTVLDIVEKLEFRNADIQNMLLDAQAKRGIEVTNPPLGSSQEERLKWMAQDLKVAAVTGDLKMLYKLIEIDPYVLENIDKIPFVDTPLHIAVAAGHVRFATEIIRLKPSFAKKLNEHGLSPMHLALQNTDMVYRFLSINKELIRVKGRKGLTPLHLAAKSGEVESLAKFLLLCPDSIEDVTIKGETALHIAVRKKRFEALQVLVGGVRRFTSNRVQDNMLNWKNESGDTILHVSVRMNDAQTVKFLIDEEMNLNVKNLGGSTALDIVESEMPQFASVDIRRMLLSAKAKRGTDVTGASSLVKGYLTPKLTTLNRIEVMTTSMSSKIDDTARNAFLVVAVLVATMTYQSALSPPGGLYQADASPDSTNTTSTQGNKHEPGTSVMDDGAFSFFFVYNSLSLLMSTSVICFLLPTGTFSFLLLLTVCYFWNCYLFAIYVIAPTNFVYHLIISFTSLILWFLLKIKFGAIQKFRRKFERLNFELMSSGANRW